MQDHLTKTEGTTTTTQPVEFNRVTDYSTFWAEWEIREDDVLIHLFARAGRDDVWTDGHYIGRCRRCGRERKELKGVCACGHMGLVYVPGRCEVRTATQFPGNMRDIIKRAVDACWMGNVAIESTADLYARTDNELGVRPGQDPGAWVIQLQGAGQGDHAGMSLMLGRLFDGIDEGMESK